MYVKMRGYRYQRGFIDVILYGALFVFSVMTWLLYQQDLERFKDDSANQAGVYAAQFKHALQSKLSQDGVGIAAGTFTGTAWLKDSATCTSGTGTMQHLPCTFPDNIAFGLSYTTVVSVSGGIVTMQTALGAPTYRGDVKPSISGRIVAAINGANSAYSTPITQVYFVANHDLVTGAITMTVTNSQSLDYLKPDGTVFPTANFNWNNYDINNVGTLSATTANIDTLNATTGNISIIRDGSNYLDADGVSSLNTVSMNRGLVSRAPTDAIDLANKAYVDSRSSPNGSNIGYCTTANWRHLRNHNSRSAREPGYLISRGSGRYDCGCRSGYTNVVTGYGFRYDAWDTLRFTCLRN